MRRLPVAVVTLLVLFIGGCAVLPPPPPDDTFYRLPTPAAAGRLSEPALPGVVEVVRFTADGVTGERALVHARAGGSHVLSSYAYHLWTDSPTALLQEALVDHLRAAGAAETVVTSNLRLVPDFVIQGHIKRFEQVAALGPAGRAAGAAEAVVAIELAVTDRRDERLVLLRDYEARRPASSGAPEAAVRAMSAAVAEVFEAFVADLDENGGAEG